MKRLCLILLLFAGIITAGIYPAKGQNLPMPTDDLLRASSDEGSWNFMWRTALNGSQTYFRSWAQGGVDRVQVVGSTRFTGVYTEGAYQYGTLIDLRYGQTRLDRGDFRKSQDVLLLRNQFRRRFADPRFSLRVNVNFESQFDKGYDRSFENVLSRFMAPGTLTETAGLSFDPDDHLQTTFGISLRQTFVRDTSLSPRYGLSEDTWFRNEAGFTVILRFDREIWENVSYSGYLETFSNLQKSLLNTDFTITNEFVARVNNYLTTNLEISFQYNDDITKKLQVRQILSVGFNYRIL